MEKKTHQLSFMTNLFYQLNSLRFITVKSPSFINHFAFMSVKRISQVNLFASNQQNNPHTELIYSPVVEIDEEYDGADREDFKDLAKLYTTVAKSDDDTANDGAYMPLKANEFNVVILAAPALNAKACCDTLFLWVGRFIVFVVSQKCV